MIRRCIGSTTGRRHRELNKIMVDWCYTFCTNTPHPHSTSVHLQTHAIVNLVVRQRNVILKDGIPFLQLDFRRISACLRGYQLLQISHRVVGATFDAHCERIHIRIASPWDPLSKVQVARPLRPNRSFAITSMSAIRGERNDTGSATRPPPPPP